MEGSGSECGSGRPKRIQIRNKGYYLGRPRIRRAEPPGAKWAGWRCIWPPGKRRPLERRHCRRPVFAWSPRWSGWAERPGPSPRDAPDPAAPWAVLAGSVQTPSPPFRSGGRQDDSSQVTSKKKSTAGSQQEVRVRYLIDIVSQEEGRSTWACW
jgi:hypothetical protein